MQPANVHRARSDPISPEVYVLAAERVRHPVDSRISKWVYRQFSQSCCPFNIKFAQELKEPAFRPRAFLAGKDAQTLARDLLAMGQADFSVAFRKSPMKRAKLAGLQRNARLVLGNGGELWATYISWPCSAVECAFPDS